MSFHESSLFMSTKKLSTFPFVSLCHLYSFNQETAGSEWVKCCQQSQNGRRHGSGSGEERPGKNMRLWFTDEQSVFSGGLSMFLFLFFLEGVDWKIADSRNGKWIKH